MDRIIKFNDFQKEASIRGQIYKKAINKVIDSGWYILGEEVKGFEEEYKKYMGVNHCIGVANGLEALQISLMSLGIGAGDEVITTPLSAIATSLSIMAVGATPVYCDVDSRGQMDFRKIEKLITSNTKAIMPVHLYGLSSYPEQIKKICKGYNLYYVEDACQAHGSHYDGKKLGTFGDISAFSFYPTKNLGCFGDGGAIITNNSELAERCRRIRDYGQSGKYVHSEYGLNSRLDEIQASVLRKKLEFLPEDNEARRRLAEIYKKRLSIIPEIEIFVENKNEKSNYHLFVISTNKRDELQKFLKEFNIPTLVHYPLPLPYQPLFKDKYKTTDLKNVRNLSSKILSLPIHPFLSSDDVEFICDKIYKFFKK